MAGVVIPGLGRKLTLLIDHGHFKDRDNLAEAFNRARSTVYGWGHGGDARAPGTIPSNQTENLVEAVRSCLPPETTFDEAKYLAFAPVAELEMRLSMQAQSSLINVIDNEAVRNAGRLIPMPPADAGLIETDLEPQEPDSDISVHIDQWFRIEFSTAMTTGHVIALQHVGQSWGPVSCYVDKKARRIMLPGRNEAGQLAHIRERKEDGLHQFIVLQTPEPPPTEFRRYLTDKIALDGTIIRQVTDFFSGQPVQRKLFLLEVDITTRKNSSS